MYRCYECRRLFHEPDQFHYREDMSGEGHWQDFYIPVCPYCGGEEIADLPDLDEEEFDL